MADNIDIKDANGTPRAIATKNIGDVHYNNHIIADENGNLAGMTNNSLDVSTRTKPSNGFIEKFNRITNQTTLANDAVLFGSTVVVTNAAGIAVGSLIIIFNEDLNRFTTFEATNVAGTTITLDSQIDVPYPAGSNVDVAVTNMAENGTLASPKIFGLRNSSTVNPVALTAVVERIIFKCYTTTAPDIAQFGNITKLTNGLSLRRADGEYVNIFNFKDNGSLAGIDYDWTPTSAIGSGQDGFFSRLTFSRFGGSQELAPNEDLQFLVADNLTIGTPNIQLLEITAEGYII